MSDKVKIILKKDQPQRVERTVGNHRISAVQGEPVEVERNEALFWIGGGRFELVEGETLETTEDEPLTVESLVKNHNKDELLEMAGSDNSYLNKTELAQMIVAKQEEKTNE